MNRGALIGRSIPSHRDPAHEKRGGARAPEPAETLPAASTFRSSQDVPGDREAAQRVRKRTARDPDARRAHGEVARNGIGRMDPRNSVSRSRPPPREQGVERQGPGRKNAGSTPRRPEAASPPVGGTPPSFRSDFAPPEGVRQVSAQHAARTSSRRRAGTPSRRTAPRRIPPGRAGRPRWRPLPTRPRRRPSRQHRLPFATWGARKDGRDVEQAAAAPFSITARYAPVFGRAAPSMRSARSAPSAEISATESPRSDRAKPKP
jgi:hypothetical protein